MVQEALLADSKEVEAIVLWAAHLLEINSLEEADNLVITGLSEAPDDFRLLVLSAQVQERLGNTDLATDRFAKAVRLREYDPRTVRPYVQFLTRIGRDEAAATVLTETNRRHPTDEGILDQLGFVRAKLGDWDGATKVARSLAQTNPDRARQLRAAILIGQERFDEGADLLKQLPSDERQRAASVAALVQTYIRNGEVGRATGFLDGLLEENPSNLQALGLRGNIHLASGEQEKAAALYRRILDVDPGNAGALSALARMYQTTGDSEEAEQSLLDGLAINPDNLFLKTRLAQFRELQGEFDSAIELYSEVYEQVPNSLLIANNLSSLLADHRADDAEAVERAYKMANRLRDTQLPHYRDTFGWTRHLRGEHEEALAYIEPVVEALPMNGWVHYHIGMVYVALKRNEEAKEHLERAVELMAGRDFPPADKIAVTLEQLKES
ncbi:MAG: tetratricopeptide repeat protein [Verrucomicrobiota bacterium]